MNIHGGMTTTLGYKNTSFYSFKRGHSWCECKRERERQTEGDKYSLSYWSITSSLIHTMLCYLQGPTLHFFCFLAGGILNLRPTLCYFQGLMFSLHEMHSTGPATIVLNLLTKLTVTSLHRKTETWLAWGSAYIIS